MFAKANGYGLVLPDIQLLHTNGIFVDVLGKSLHLLNLILVFLFPILLSP